MTVYVMVSDGGPVKVGIATNLKSRLSAVQTGSPHKITLAYHAETDGRDRRVELMAHRLLQEFRMNGEWFDVSADEAVEAIRLAIETPDDVPLPRCSANDDWNGVDCRTPADLRAARKMLGLTQSGLARALRLSEKNGDRSIRVWETEGNTVPGPVQVAVELLLEQIPILQTSEKPPRQTRRNPRL